MVNQVDLYSYQIYKIQMISIHSEHKRHLNKTINHIIENKISCQKSLDSF